MSTAARRSGARRQGRNARALGATRAACLTATLTTWGLACFVSVSGAQPPVGSLDPVTSGAVDSTAWVASPADSLINPDESWDHPDTLVGAANTTDPAGSRSNGTGDRPATNASSDLQGGVGGGRPPASRTWGDAAGSNPIGLAAPRKLAAVASGVYGGYPSWGGAMIVAPADGPAAFRSGIIGLPNIGILWTPGFEFRFNQPSGTYATDGGFFFGDLFLGRSYLDGRRDYTAMETGFGYRWILSDRRGLRWIAAVEAGGYWRPESAWPYRPALRAYWLLVE